MKDKRSWIVAIVWAVSFAFIWYNFNNRNSQQVIPPLTQLVAQAQKLEKSAGTDTKKLKSAAKAYESAANIKQYKQSDEAADARMHAAGIYVKIKDNNTAVSAYTNLVRDFPPKDSRIGAEAQVRLNALKSQMTAKHVNDPGYKAIDWLVAITGRNPSYSYALALLIITLIFKLITTPLSHIQYKSMKEMQKVQPLMKQLQEKYKDDKQELGKKTMELYKEHGVNPLSGCLPLLVQMPILIGLYKYVITPYQFEFAKGTFLWIGSALAHKWPAVVAANLSMPDMPLLIIYTISMIISQKLTVVDPSQAEQQKMMAWAMPIMFAFMFKSFPAAFMLYWLFFNVISTAQQYSILNKPSGSNGTTTGTATTGNGSGGGEPEALPKKSVVVPGNRSRKRRRRFLAVPIQHPVLHPTPGV